MVDLWVIYSISSNLTAGLDVNKFKAILESSRFDILDPPELSGLFPGNCNVGHARLSF